ncbi:dimethylhistidine N-methyltransferase [Povalibacter uvarum]|uniref:Dimethylhistidine N-methyltransferase n=1 Tax=Povalibacter uvarum TaxID=732238 RepID=A0A841HH66_9GAMM|nr:L-histidine N(alpha)-methyltransferase [Povalibacter uvarum]MBB6092491.1 dimethylhistidine N-methyltransferase [Povalibacter uvarum]
MSKRPNALPAPNADALTSNVLDGLRKTPKELSAVWFYDEYGSTLFDSICELPEYYLTRTELGIMQMHAAEMAQIIGPQAALIEFGSGTSQKTRLLLDHLVAPVAYVPVDIAREHLIEAAGTLARDYPTLQIAPVCADFTQPFDLPKQVASAQRRVVYFPGSTLGNFSPEQAAQLLDRMHKIVGNEGAVLIGIDLKKDLNVLRRAYNDAAGVTAEFNLNALRHINREIGANFDLRNFQHEALWVEDASRIEMHLISKRDQTVTVAGTPVQFRRGEHMRTEYCHKYTLEGFANLAATAQLSAVRTWTDVEKKFAVQLLEPRKLQ